VRMRCAPRRDVNFADTAQHPPSIFET